MQNGVEVSRPVVALKWVWVKHGLNLSAKPASPVISRVSGHTALRSTASKPPAALPSSASVNSSKQGCKVMCLRKRRHIDRQPSFSSPHKRKTFAGPQIFNGQFFGAVCFLSAGGLLQRSRGFSLLRGLTHGPAHGDAPGVAARAQISSNWKFSNFSLLPSSASMGNRARAMK
jgi:hypothetical protein